jgi:hypothetical protein
MSVSDILSSGTLSQSWQNRHTQAQEAHTEFQQLGRDLQSGNLNRARSDFSALSQTISGSLKSNNSLSPALSAPPSAPYYHHHAGVSWQGGTSSTESPLLQQFSSLGSALQAGNLAAAQAAYSTLQQDLELSGWRAGTPSPTTSGAVSIAA